MDEKMRALIDAPLADPAKLYLPEGKRRARRVKTNYDSDDIGCPKASQQELDERAAKSQSEKLDKLFEYYATTSLPNERVAEYLGVTVERVEREMLWRRRVK